MKNNSTYNVKVASCAFSFLFIALLSFGQGSLIGMVGSKINDKSAWNKFKKSQVVSNKVLNGDTLFYLRTSEEAINKLAGTTKYYALSTAIASLENNLNATLQQVQAGNSIDHLVTNNDALIDKVIARDKDVDVDYYRREQAFYRQYQTQYASRQKARADSIALARQKAQERAEEEAKARAAASANEAAKNNAGASTALNETVASKTSGATYDGMDSALVVKMYGSSREYEEQKAFQYESSHKHLVLFYGKSTAWANELSLYLQDKGWSVEKVTNAPGKYTNTMKGPCYGCKENTWPRIIIDVYFNAKTDKIQKLVLTGKNTGLENLFVEYWEIADIKFDQLKTKGVFYHEVLSDKISLSSNPLSSSTITISANPKVGLSGK